MSNAETPGVITLLENADLLTYAERFGTSEGHFVRVGRIVMVSPHSELHEQFNIDHFSLLQSIATSDDLADWRNDEVQRAARLDEPVLTFVRHSWSNRPTVPTIANDAGIFDVRRVYDAPPEVKGVLTPHLLVIRGIGLHFSTPEPRNRRRTRQVVQGIVGPRDFTVLTTD